MFVTSLQLHRWIKYILPVTLMANGRAGAARDDSKARTLVTRVCLIAEVIAGSVSLCIGMS